MSGMQLLRSCMLIMRSLQTSCSYGAEDSHANIRLLRSRVSSYAAE